VSELKYSWHRECARAIARYLDDHDADDAAAQDLSKRLNLYLGTRALERWDSDGSSSRAAWDEEWARRSIVLAEITCPDHELVGPSAGYADQRVEEELITWFDSIAA
jgi:hypothetical protein